MANQASALNWVFARSQEFGLSLSELSWIQEPLPEWKDVHCAILFKNKPIYSHGAATDQNIALIKSISEALERVVVESGNFQTSNGHAAHLDFERAKVNALSELRERDLFLCHFLTGTPFPALKQIPSAFKSMHSIEGWATSNGLDVKFFHLGKLGAICLIRGAGAKFPFGLTIGIANRLSFEDSLISAFIEAARQGIGLIKREGAVSGLTIEEFNSIEHPTLRHHGLLTLSLEYASAISPLFSSGPEDSNSFGKELGDEDISFRQHYWMQDPKSDCPFVFAQAKSPMCQDLWIGHTTKKHINFERLSAFLGRDIDWVEINKLPHPID